jgi:hypothetical protein
MPEVVARALGIDVQEQRAKRLRVDHAGMDAQIITNKDTSATELENAEDDTIEGYEFGEEDVERQMLIQMAEEDAAERGVDVVFMELLRERKVDPLSLWTDVERALADDPRYDLATAKLRKDVFAQYCAEAARRIAESTTQAQKDGDKRKKVFNVVVVVGVVVCCKITQL